MLLYLQTPTVSSLLGFRTFIVARHEKCPLLLAPANFVVQPINTTVKRNESAIFSVRVTGEIGTVSYQWQRMRMDLMIGRFEGVNTANLTINSAQKSDEGGYRCVVTITPPNVTTSEEAFLTVGKTLI